jgi:hypothetical protein
MIRMALFALLSVCSALRLQTARPRCRAQMSSPEMPSRRVVVSSAALALLFGSDAALAKGKAPVDAAPAASSSSIDWASLGVSRESLGLPPDEKAKPDPKKAAEQKKAAEKAAAEKAKAEKRAADEAAKRKAAETKAADKAVASKPGKGKKNADALDLESLGLTKEALGLEQPKKRGAPKPPLPGQKAKAPPKPKPKPTREQLEKQKKKEKARQEKARASKKKADAKEAERKKKAQEKARQVAKQEAEAKKQAAAEQKLLRAWKAYTADGSGKTYYYNAITKESTYTKPEGL